MIAWIIDWAGEEWTAALFGLLGGIVLGIAARVGRFCSLGAIEDQLYAGSTLRLQMWGVAIAVAITASFAAIAAGLVDPMLSFYLSQQFNPLPVVIGGLIFGYGMAIAGNCGFGALARLGGGDIRAFVILLIIGIAAYVMTSGPLADLRVMLFPPVATEVPQSFAHALSPALGVAPEWIGLAVGLLGLTLLATRAHELREAPSYAVWGAVVGLAITGGWVSTAWIAEVGFAAPELRSHTFSTPVGDTLLYAMLSTGLTVNFGMGSVAGVVLGSAMGSLWLGQFRWEACDDPRELQRQMSGGWLMGFGSVLALGCSLGQGLSAMSLLAYSAPLVLVSIYIGARLGLRQLIEGFSPAE
jgi:uncharacterized membrane protein YedE/YeeE